MASNMKEITARINGIKNSSQITNAMNIVSTTKFKKFQTLTLKARAYSHTLREIFQDLLSELSKENHVLFNGKKKVKRVGIIIMSSDRGLCGAFNSNTFKRVNKMIKEFETEGKSVSLITIGKKAVDYAKNNNIDVDSEYSLLIPEIMLEKSRKISMDIVEYYLSNFYDEVYMVYSKFNSIISYEIQVLKLLPFKNDNIKGTNISFEYDPNKEDVLVNIIPQLLHTDIYQAMLENTSSEHSARMTAMKNASDNAEELIKSLTLEYNRARQSTITQELTEIVSGAQALK